MLEEGGKGKAVNRPPFYELQHRVKNKQRSNGIGNPFVKNHDTPSVEVRTTLNFLMILLNLSS